MNRKQRLKFEMFVRVRNFGAASSDVFPKSTPGGQKFSQLAEVVTSIETHLVRRAQARAEARKVKVATWRAALDYMKAIASTGRQAADEEPAPHPFRMPARYSAAILLTTARMFFEEADRRKETFVELGMPPTFLDDFRALIANLAGAVGLQQDSRGARRKARAGIETGLARGGKLIAKLDVTVANTLRTDPVRLAEWQGARRVDRLPSSNTAMTSEPTTARTSKPASVPASVPRAVPPADPPEEEVLEIAS